MFARIYFALLVIAVIACKDEPKEAQVGLLSNGFQYKMYVDEPGDPAQSGQVITMDFEVIDDSGVVLDDSRRAPIRPSTLVPANLTEDVKKNPLFGLISIMSPGDSADVYVPIDSLPNPPNNFRHSKMITYRVKLLTVENAREYSKRMHSQENAEKVRREQLVGVHKKEAVEAFNKYKAGILNGRVVEKNQGMKVVVIDEGNGTTAEWGEEVDVHYFGFFEDGESFDNSYVRGEPFTLKIGSYGAIQGWLTGIPEVPEGGSAILDIPAPLAYGAEGSPPLIPPNADLIFYVKVEKVYKQK